MTTSPVPLPVQARVRRRHNRRVSVLLARRAFDRALTDFVYGHQGVITLLAVLAAGVMIAVAARVLLATIGL